MTQADSARAIDLQTLLGDTPRAVYEAEIRDRRLLHVPGALSVEEARTLFSIERFDELATCGDVPYPDIEVIEEGKPGSPPVDKRNRPLPGILGERLAVGATLRMRAIADMDIRVNALAMALASDLDAAIQCNAFLTPAHSTGFSPHYDTRDIWVVQTHGSKIWRIHEQGKTGPMDMELPHSEKGYNANSMSVGPVIDEVTLREGDALYLPRGTGHAPVCTDQPSLHITFSMAIITVGDVAIEYLRKLHLAQRPLRERVSHAELTNPAMMAERLNAAGLFGAIDTASLAKARSELMSAFTETTTALPAGSILSALQAKPEGNFYDYRPETVWRTIDDGAAEMLFVGRNAYKMGAREMAMIRKIAADGIADATRLEADNPGIGVAGILAELTRIGVLRRRIS